MSVVFYDGIPFTFNNVSKSYKYHYVSYNCSSATPYGCPTTALVIYNHVFIILCGDHFKNLNSASENGLETAWEYIVKNAKELHAMGDHNAVVGITEDVFSCRETAVKYLSNESLNALYLAVTNNT